MQAFALTVIDFDGGKLEQLAEQLNAQGYATASVTVSQDDGAPAASFGNQPAAGADTAAATTASAGELEFKCPACGRSFDAQVVCSTEHEPTQTLPTGDVLAGATPQAPEAATGAEQTADAAEGAEQTADAAEAAPGGPVEATEPGDATVDTPAADAPVEQTAAADTSSSAAAPGPTAAEPAWPQ